MAQTSRIDELNVLGNSQKKERPNIRKFFEEMELPKEEIEERITVANQLYTTINYAFLLMLATKKVDKKINYPYYSDYIERYFTDVLSQNGYDTTDEYYQEYLRETSEEVIDTTQRNGAGEYYLSTDRAETIAENTTNAVANYKREQDAIKQGYTMKRWVSLIDKHTRKTHVHADGKEVKIGTPFTIGGFKMMFPLDGSLCGFSNPQEVINCRCVCKYFGKDKTIVKNELQENRNNGIMSPSEMNLQFFASKTPQERVKQYGGSWEKASFKEALLKFESTEYKFNAKNTKLIYNTNRENVSLVYDIEGKYFTIEDSSLNGKRVYLGLDGKQIPNNYVNENGKQSGLPRSEYRRMTHFLDSDKTE